ncbi:transposase-like protein [Bradyrhizobium yuanmingense]|uniref:Mutator family transposase n=1 Tax=Bradyrhizobium yuanmingense TaxID=108015 RepID=A0ABV4G8V5_9BRAD
MNETTNILAFRQPSAADDPLTEILRNGARELLARAVEIELQAFLATTAELKLPDGRARVVRHGFGPARKIATGIGAIEIARPKVRDRGATGAERIRFTSAILPRWARRTKSLDTLLPILYLRGISTGDFQEALSALLGKDAPNLSPSVISGLEGIVVATDSQVDGVQADRCSLENLASIEGHKSVAEAHRRCQIRRRHRGHSDPAQPRRLIGSVTHIQS